MCKFEMRRRNILGKKRLKVNTMNVYGWVRKEHNRNKKHCKQFGKLLVDVILLPRQKANTTCMVVCINDLKSHAL